MSLTPAARNPFVPLKTFKLVYLIILVVTLFGLVVQLSNTATVGFMTLIDGRANADTGRGVMIAMFASWAFFIFATYLHVETFEDKAGAFTDIQRPGQKWVIWVEWIIRFGLVGIITVKLWKPESYQAALFVLSGICALLFAWTVIVWRGFKGKWDHADFALLAMSGMALLVAWLSYDHQREAKFGLLIVVGLAVLFLVTITLALRRTVHSGKAALHCLL